MGKIKIKKYANAIFQWNIFDIGGVETFIYEICQKYKTYDIDIFYGKCGVKQLERLERVIGKDHIHKLNGEIIYCHKAILSWDIGWFINNIFADEIIQFQHADWSQKVYTIKPSVHEKIDTYLAVSDVASKGFKIATNNKYKVKTCYPPISIRPEDKRRVLTLVSACRLSEEKGKSRMIKLIRELNKNNIPFYYHIFTTDVDVIHEPNVMYHTPTLDIRPYIKDADYLVQLSDTESFCYSLVESLMLSTPVICTDMPIVKELGIKNGVNGFVLPFDMHNIPITEIYEKDLKGFTYKPTKDEIEKHLYKGKSNYVEEKIMKVKMIKPVKDTVAKVHYVLPREYGLSKIATDGWENKPIGTIVDMEKSRADVIVKNGYGIYVDDPVAKIKKPRASKTNLKKVK